MKNICNWAFIGFLLAFSPLHVLAQSADDYVIRGNNALAKQNYTNAIAEYGKAIELDPELAAKLNPYLARAYGKRGAAYYLTREYSKAIADFNESLKLVPDNPEIGRARAFAEKARGNPPHKDPAPPGAHRAAAALTLSPAWQSAPPAAATQKNKSVFVWTGIVLILIVLMLLPWRKQISARLRHIGFNSSGPGLTPDNPPAAKAVVQPREFTPASSPIKTGVVVAGQMLGGRYELRGGLGEGAMGVVYEAWDRKNNLRVAVKRMHSYLKEYPEEYNRFRREAKIVEQLKHPNIICIHGLIEQAGDIYLVFDYVAGKTLHDVLKEKKRFQLQECKDIFNGVCDAVHYAHKNNIIHRDLKPANIMLAGPARAMVMDFGLASELREGLTRVTHQTTSGTPAFMAPEQHTGTVKRESDIYAMGVCLYEMLTGELPFTGFDNLAQKKLKNYREATAIVSWLPTGVDEVISRALEPEPSQRYADALDFWSALRNL